MGAPPLKLVDGIWFGIDGQWAGRATNFSSGYGYTRFDLPATGGLQLQRTDFAPDGHRAALFGLQMTNSGKRDRKVTVRVDAHSELMTAFPWGFSGVTPNAKDNLPDHGTFTGRALQFTDDGTAADAPKGTPAHHYAALVAASQDPASGEAADTGGAYRGPQGAHVCHDGDQSLPSACDDGPFGRGTGGELRYSVTVAAHASKTLWVAAAGSDQGLPAARDELAAALADPPGELADKIASREQLASWSTVSLPGDPLLQHAIEWGKQNLADLTQTASGLQRWTGDNGFMHEMYDFAKRNLQAVDRRLDIDHDGWPEGSGNVERTGMGPEKLDNGVYYMRALLDLADMANAENDSATSAWATKLANQLQRQFESTWWNRDPAAQQYADSLVDPGNVQSFQKHWIGQVPMEAELTRGDQVSPGVASYDHGTTALAGRENSCFSGSRPGSLGLFHTGCGGGADGQGDFEIFSLTTAIQAVGEGNYGRLLPGQQQRYTDANAETMFSEPSTAGTPDEQPGAMPEIFPSAPNGDPAKGIPPNIDRCWTCRSMVMQAWGNYGTAWPVVHQQLGVRPLLDQGELQVVPQVPPQQPSVQGSNIRVGGGSVDVFAAHSGSVYTTRVDAGRTPLGRLLIGHTLPAGSRPTAVTVDGQRVSDYDARVTNRGLEVTVSVTPTAQHTLTITAR